MNCAQTGYSLTPLPRKPPSTSRVRPDEGSAPERRGRQWLRLVLPPSRGDPLACTPIILFRGLHRASSYLACGDWINYRTGAKVRGPRPSWLRSRWKGTAGGSVDSLCSQRQSLDRLGSRMQQAEFGGPAASPRRMSRSHAVLGLVQRVCQLN